MMFSAPCRFTALVIWISAASLAFAQHDPHRNATQAIALGDLTKAERELAKAKADDSETHFVRMMAALKADELESAVGHARAALDAGLPLPRLAAGPRELLAALHETDDYQSWRAEHGNPRLLHGPMVGAVTDSAASFWVRTAGPAELQVVIGERRSRPIKTGPDSDFTAVARIEGLEPATAYTYYVLIDGERAEPGRRGQARFAPKSPQNESVTGTRFTTFPAAGRPAQFSVAFGGGAGYVPMWERMWDTIAGYEPAALLMLGDNVYIDQPEHTLCQHYCYYRRQTRPEWRRLVAATAVYAIYDDHDFGTNDCIPGPEIESPPWKRSVWNIFRQNWVNPVYGGGESQPGCWFDFTIGDVHFIMLDGRYYRDLKRRDLKGGSMLGPVQKAWLFETLKKSTATFKVFASPVPWTEGVKPGSKDPWDGFPQEREEIFSFLEANKIDGVFLIAADRHRTDLRKTERPGGYDLYEYESSRLTNRHTHGVVKIPGLIWGYNKTCSFGLMRFDTTAADPLVTFECITIDGDVVHQHELRASRLKH